ncbi:MAG: helix-turn-helix domain-containing protein [Solimonas sp.]
MKARKTDTVPLLTPELRLRLAGLCSIAAAVEFIGDRWSLLLLRELFQGVHRFDDFVRHTGCSTAVLSVRLKKLVDAGIVRRQSYRDEGARPRHEYRLTQKGVDLLPVVVGLMQWGDRHAAGAEGGPVILRDRRSGERVRAALVSESGRLVEPQDSLPTLNPAYARRR